MTQQCKIYMARNRPVMFKGAAKEWPAASKWNLGFFSEGAMGDTTINVSLDGKVCACGNLYAFVIVVTNAFKNVLTHKLNIG